MIETQDDPVKISFLVLELGVEFVAHRQFQW